jgi:hypothetical protein
LIWAASFVKSVLPGSIVARSATAPPAFANAASNSAARSFP